MIEEIEEQEFYQCDFTTASAWEVFISRLEEVIHDWKLSNLKRGPPLKSGDLSKNDWEITSEKVSFADVDFVLTRHRVRLEDAAASLPGDQSAEPCQALADMMSLENTFPEAGAPAPPVVCWFGLRDFLVLAPARGAQVSSESKLKMLLSSVCMAVSNSGCELPVLVQALEPWQQYCVGVCEARGVRTEFEMVHLKRPPPHCKHLTGLVEVFKSKLMSAVPLEPVTVSVRFTYVLRDWTSSTWSQEPPDFDFLQGEMLGVLELGKLPFGATFDPISELSLHATWPQLAENVVVDSESYSDLEPAHAPLWSVRVAVHERPACLLGECLAEFLQLCSQPASLADLLGDLVADRASRNFGGSLSVLTESPVPTISKMLRRATGSGGRPSPEGPLSEEVLMPILFFLFPDADSKCKSPYADSMATSYTSEEKNSLMSGLKSAARDGLVWRLAVATAHAVHTLGGPRAAAHLWYELGQELRYRWEKNIPVPGVAPGFPDHRTCLLHQKLQMFNCCVERRAMRERLAVSWSSPQPLESDEPRDTARDKRPRHKHSLWNQPVGRLERHGDLRLLHTGEHLYIPVTQDPVPKTEDQIEEDANVLIQLGTDSEGVELRARMMSASLLSDMESFKAANPGAVLEDFIRWYSPRDWIEGEEQDDFGQKKGTLSQRMQIKDNMWVEVWNAAKPVPAQRQKRLFDDTCEAEKVLFFFSAQRMSGVARLLLPTLVHAAVSRLVEEQKDYIPGLEASMQSIVKRAERLTRNPHPSQRHYEELVSELVGAETVVAQAISLEHKFCSDNSVGLQVFLARLMTETDVEVPGGPWGAIGNKIRAMFGEAQKALQLVSKVERAGEDEPWSHSPAAIFPPPTKREFVLRAVASRPAPYSAPSPQRMYCSLQRHEFRLAGAFSLDTVFQ
ncbi:rab3 GTPase-activating protein catalytic subunit isoform X2 [Bacillus rossius redtenbacheri]|uniref:rab3 GTPase-activating protein catalytic subunit isoform X2 n=1 Tax=Bacillus rossius redtenbacheri TaxID=93214 RepID=UPI002FDE30E4